MPTFDRLSGAVDAGIIDAGQAERLAAYLARDADGPARPDATGDAEAVRFARGFHDVFLTIGIATLLIGTGLAGALLVGPAGPLGAAALAWGLAEFYARRRRLVLPSIALALGFAGASATGAGTLTDALQAAPANGEAIDWTFLAATAAALLASLAFRARFGLPFALGQVAVCLAALPLVALAATSPGFSYLLSRPIVAIAGLAIFRVAMSYDLADRERRTANADNAFWLHLVAAPLIVHGLVGSVWFGRGGQSVYFTEALFIVAVLAGLALVAVAVDRRALLVGGLSYFGVAISAILRNIGTDVGVVSALSLLLLGGGVVVLGTNWRAARGFVLRRLVPATLAPRLPPLT